MENSCQIFSRKKYGNARIQGNSRRMPMAGRGDSTYFLVNANSWHVRHLMTRWPVKMCESVVLICTFILFLIDIVVDGWQPSSGDQTGHPGDGAFQLGADGLPCARKAATLTSLGRPRCIRFFAIHTQDLLATSLFKVGFGLGLHCFFDGGSCRLEWL